MSTSNYFKNKNVVITGGSSGLGRALALQLSELGACVAALARDPTKLAALRRDDRRILTLQGDISDKHQIYPLAGELQSRLGAIDLLFNVASSLGPTPLRLLLDTACEDFEAALQTNVLGPFRLTKALAAGMVLKGRGVVINISSDAAVNSYPRWGAYGVSKAAIDHLSRVFDSELHDQGVRFLSIDPGDMNTPMHFAAIPTADAKRLRDPAESARRIIELLATQDFSQVRRAV